MKKPTIGFIGQGYIGKNYADDFEKRKFTVVRYSLDAEYVGNKDAIKECDIVFVAVPTPTTPKGFDGSLVEKVLSLVGDGKIAVIKSTMDVGFNKKLQKKYPKIIVLDSPEFLSEATAAHDASHPFANIVGLPKNTPEHKNAGALVLSVLPKSPFSQMTTSDASEIIKYTHNCYAYMEIIFFNVMYDFAKKNKVDWSVIQEFIIADPSIGNRYSNPLHKKGRGAGGHCFIKDFATFKNSYMKMLPKDANGIALLQFAEKKNIELLKSTKKDIDLLRGVYGNKI